MYQNMSIVFFQSHCNEETLSLPFPDVFKKCDEIYDTVSISVAKASAVEQEAKKQLDSKGTMYWYNHCFQIV